MKMHIKDTEDRTYCGRHGAAAWSAMPVNEWRKLDAAERCIRCYECFTGVKHFTPVGTYSASQAELARKLLDDHQAPLSKAQRKTLRARLMEYDAQQNAIGTRNLNKALGWWR